MYGNYREKLRVYYFWELRYPTHKDDKLNVPFITWMCQSLTRLVHVHVKYLYLIACVNKSVFNGLCASVKEIYNNEGLDGFFR